MVSFSARALLSVIQARVPGAEPSLVSIEDPVFWGVEIGIILS